MESQKGNFKKGCEIEREEYFLHVRLRGHIREETTANKNHQPHQNDTETLAYQKTNMKVEDRFL